MAKSLRAFSFLLVLVASSVLMIGQSNVGQEPSTQVSSGREGQVLALDPLTVQEKQSAENVASADARVSKLLGTGRRQLVSVELFPVKPPAEQMAAAAAGRQIALNRYAEVIFLRYEREAGVRAIVDLTKQSVIEVTQIAADQVPLTETDLAEAARLALADPEVSRALGADASRFRPESSAERTKTPQAEQYVIEGLPVRASRRGDPCWRHRCLQLLFRTGDAYLMKPVVVVDLTSHQVRVQKARTEMSQHEDRPH